MQPFIRALSSTVVLHDTTYIRMRDGSLRRRDPKVRGKANVKRAKRERQRQRQHDRPSSRLERAS